MIASMRLLELAKPSYTHAIQSSEARKLDKREDDFHFVSDFLFAVLLSHYSKPEELHRILRLDCVRSWNGWRESDAQLLQCGCDDEKEDVAAEFVQRLQRIVRDNQHVEAQSDTARRQELRRLGKVFGIGAVHGHNECCADSLLQLLEAHGFFRGTWGSSPSACARRLAAVAERSSQVRSKTKPCGQSSAPKRALSPTRFPVSTIVLTCSMMCTQSPWCVSS